MSKGLEKEKIKQLTDYLRDYGIQHGLPQEALAQGAGVNVSYINAMLNGATAVGKTKIADVYYRRVAEYIGYNLEKVYWVHKDIDEYIEVYTELMDAKVNSNMKIIINNSGFGKTYTVGRFKKENMKHNYRITVSSLHRLDDILEDIGNTLNIENLRRGKVSRLRQIAIKLQKIRFSGGRPVLVIDEAENLTVNTLKMMKALYDAIHYYCPIVLIGTDDLIQKLDYLLEHKEPGIKQFYRRWKSGIRIVKSRDKEEVFAPFLECVEDKNLRELLCALCDNIGELHDYLEPALRMADEMGVPLTEEFFKQLYNL